MAEFLELPHLSQRNSVAEMDVDAGRIDAVLDPQRQSGAAAPLQLLRQFLFRNDFLDAAANHGKLIDNGGECGPGLSIMGEFQRLRPG
jgi:hypothetical protein